MAVLQHACSAPLARALRARAAASIASSHPVRLPRAGSGVLLGLSEPELRQLALDLDQVNRIIRHSKAIEGSSFMIYCTRPRLKKSKTLATFVVLVLCHCILSRHVLRGMISFAVTVPQAFRESLREAGWRVGRSPVHHVVSAADGTLKVKNVLAIEDLFKHRVTNVVFMGMGEPMLNLKSVLKAHTCLNKVLAFMATLESKKITVSVRQTRGLDASAACGQLRNAHQKSPLVEVEPLGTLPQLSSI
ncbi:hypothetical protein B296_00014875 [Ensete ventricosum]|uniref:Uncharacterized protein n=1 Tax=Ensete ventricosum TaxID=4639 RepID=A0A427AXS6_ENSVE|nr:hypothetical protein B296_00014875 [Ensete ventricosum]